MEPVRLETATGTIHGTLLLPAAASGRVPVALIIAGSGPTDRDGNTPLLPGKNDSLRLLAESLAASGVASVRYDKRGIGASAGAAARESDLRFTTFVDDAVGWLAWLRADGRFSRLAIVGHSEGSLIALLAAQRAPVERLVSLAGAGRPAAEVLTEQLERTLPPELFAASMRILGELLAGRAAVEVPPQLLVVFRPSVQPYLISWLPIDPAAELARLTIPVLVAQGTTDIQIAVADAERLARGSAHATLEVIDGMKHQLKEVREPAQQTAAYSDPTLPLHPRLVDLLRRFVAAS
jgi:alpha-beta hydrolase superfamily lysophospholipase